MSKQDRQGARTPADLERKYNFGKTFAEILGIATDAQNAVAQLETDVAERYTAMMRDAEAIIMTALDSYVETGDYSEFQKTVETQFQIMAADISMKFTTTTEQINSVDGNVQSQLAEIYKHISFDADGITIGSSENAISLNMDNDQIVFSKNGVEIVRLDIDNFTPTNVYIKSGGRLRLGDFAFDIDDYGVPSFRKVGG